MRTLRSLFAVTVLFVATLALADWPTLGGSSLRHGQCGQIGPSGADPLWEGATETAWFGDQCYIEDGRVATMRFQGIAVAPIVCHDLETGAELWQLDFPGTNSRSVPRGFRDGLVYATNFQETGADTLYALDAADGSIEWKSEVFCERGIVWSVSFTEDGDLIVPTVGNDLARVSRLDGSRVWVAPRNIPNTGAEGTCVFDGKVYGWEGFLNSPKTVSAWDAETGAYLYSSEALPGDGDQEVPLVLGPDGTVFAKRDGGALHALRDTGSGFTTLWTSPLGHVTYSGHLGVGQDGSVYLADGSTVVRLSGGEGLEIGRSAPLVSGSTLNPRFVIGQDGTLYVGNGGSADGRVYALTPELSELWSVAVPGLTRGGPAMGRFGTLVVAGSDFTLKAFRSDASSSPGGAPAADLALRAWPNPFNPKTSVRVDFPTDGHADLSVYAADGRRLAVLFSGTVRAGAREFVWDGRDDSGRALPSGVYSLKLAMEGRREGLKLVMLR